MLRIMSRQAEQDIAGSLLGLASCSITRASENPAGAADERKNQTDSKGLHSSQPASSYQAPRSPHASSSLLRTHASVRGRMKRGFKPGLS